MQSIFEKINKVLIIAEAGVNHLNSLNKARELIIAAKHAGADAIKFQTYTADELVVRGTPKFWDWEGDKKWESQYDAYDHLGGFPFEYYPELLALGEELNIEVLSTPFSIEAADKLNEMGMKSFKIASSDMSTLPLLRHIASFNKPILLSTGAATMSEIHEAVNTIREFHNKIVILHCTLCYPTKPEDANLNLLQTLREEFPENVIGISDHTLGVTQTLLAKDFGATVIEKHFTLDKNLPDSADHWLSVDPAELKQIVESHIYKYRQRGPEKKMIPINWEEDKDDKMWAPYLGSKEKKVFDCEKETRKYDKRSWVSKQFIPKGTTLNEDMLTWKRPGTGIWPNEDIVGRTATEDIPQDTTLTWDLIK